MKSPRPTNMTQIVGVLPLRPVSKLYSYRIHSDTPLVVGQIVRIPFGRKKDPEPTLGVIWTLQGDTTIPEGKLKDGVVLADWPPLSEPLRQFLEWSAHYTLSPLGAFARMALPIADVTRAVPMETRYSLGPHTAAITPKRAAVIDALQNGAVMTRKALRAVANVSDAVLKAMIDDGTLCPHTVSAEQPMVSQKNAAAAPLPHYNDAQQLAADRLQNIVDTQTFNVTLLDGVTGSGKTEVYFAAIKRVLEQGKQVLVLMPEIALTAQFLARFTARFGMPPTTWHSHLTPAQRRRHLRAIVSGDARVVLGARSALFLPYRDLGLIVIDEEHDSSYKQEEGVFYNARDLAIKRAQLCAMPVVLVSATPSLETFHHAQTGRYEWIKLPARFNDAQMPTITTIDMRVQKMPRTQFLSPDLLAAMYETLQNGDQVMLYLNRRGYAPLTLCRTCGHRIECPRCSAWMVQHRATTSTRGGLLCHHCGFQSPPPKNCPQCNTADSLVPIGPGVERIADEVRTHFLDKRLAILSSDTLQSLQALEATLDQVARHDIDILIGTQIVAKGHHFPSLTLVGVIDADLGLSGGDLRAGERTFQLLQQVAGRAGRGTKPGRVLLQSFMPEHRIMHSIVSGDRDTFLRVESEERQAAGMPPNGRLAGLIVASKKEGDAKRFAQHLLDTAPVVAGVKILGPAPAPIFKLRHLYRYRLLVKAHKDQSLQKILTPWVLAQTPPSGVRVQIDIDPYSFM